MAAAVSGKDYWCLLSSGKCSDGGPSDLSNPTRPRHRQSQVSIGNNRGGGDGGDGGEDLQYQGDKQNAAEIDSSPVQVPPSLRAVVIAVLFANRLTASAREASAARETLVNSGGGGGGVGEARLEQRQSRRQQVGGGRPTDARYMVSEIVA